MSANTILEFDFRNAAERDAWLQAERDRGEVWERDSAGEERFARITARDGRVRIYRNRESSAYIRPRPYRGGYHCRILSE